MANFTIGSTKPKKLFIGSNSVKKVYYGSTLIWSSAFNIYKTQTHCTVTVPSQSTGEQITITTTVFASSGYISAFDYIHINSTSTDNGDLASYSYTTAPLSSGGKQRVVTYTPSSDIYVVASYTYKTITDYEFKVTKKSSSRSTGSSKSLSSWGSPITTNSNYTGKYAKLVGTIQISVGTSNVTQSFSVDVTFAGAAISDLASATTTYSSKTYTAKLSITGTNQVRLTVTSSATGSEAYGYLKFTQLIFY